MYPLGILYGMVVALRNLLYQLGIKRRMHVPNKSIVVGNLSVGGTGKTPFIIYLLQLLREEQLKAHVVSRGYGRKTKGFLVVTSDMEADKVGDEPLLIKKHFPEMEMSVCENRAFAVQKIDSENPSKVYLFDDAFQHLGIRAEINILLTTFQTPFFNDCMLPAGNLREFKCGAKRADFIVVTKCPESLTYSQKELFYNHLKISRNNIFFSSISYGNLKAFSNNRREGYSHILLVTGIANPKPLVEFLSQAFHVELIQFPDHHNFTLRNIQFIHERFDIFANKEKGIIVTTEKDYVRLSNNEFMPYLNDYPWYFQPITVKLDEEVRFKNLILKYVATI